MTPYFGIVVSLAAFGIGTFLFKKSNGFFLFTPLFVAMILGIAFLKIGGFSYEDYKSGGDIIKFFLEPATIAFAIPLYKQVESLKKYWLQILGAIIAGSVCSVAVVYLIANALHLDGAVMKSMLPQAATTAIALPLSKGIGGIQDITAFAVIFNAVIVYALGALFLKIFKVQHPIAKGLALGTSGHALGVAVGIEMGEVEAAMASIAVVVVGVVTVFVVPLCVQMIGG
ncbi:Antiholin-like protein LrgB [Bacillus paralicheniformis]|uniref:Antiholin-like protein LrgB n=1 Tax=Bacillus paralicheniformis TaxID=1648923 RepID=A0A7Z0X0I1_9BACI|nr:MULTISPECIES: antiholin-like protein LrgB [Bacillus]MBC8623649.1 antiholin-like protein LrgB [Robertmurraya crescens]ARA86773.1 antiholin LrgB [Bacillus paralicheniformis]KAA0834710.1 antiholin-like protein LrgB [Bacillus paralicheniformis]KAA0844044.1 antiholin-like protein LrgB [Bacillus paralicheniformis]MBL7476693.1 antiholin-like protein LrgB [Bacillus paralicheniformis]